MESADAPMRRGVGVEEGAVVVMGMSERRAADAPTPIKVRVRVRGRVRVRVRVRV